MHELGLTQSIVAICAEHAAGQRVRRVRLEIGKLAGALPEAVRFCFDLCAAGTPVEGAELEIIEKPGLAVCRDCGGDVTLEDPFACCPCGSANLELIAGRELRVKELDVE